MLLGGRYVIQSLWFHLVLEGALHSEDKVRRHPGYLGGAVGLEPMSELQLDEGYCIVPHVGA
jgi:hypothetical protein